MKQASLILRLTSLAFLFGGSTAIVFAAIILVKTAQAQGISAAEAASANAPIFIHYAIVVLGSAFVLTVAEALDYSIERDKSKLVLSRYGASLLCIVSAIIFGFGIVPPMKKLLPQLKANTAAHARFTKLHGASRLVFSSIIVCAFISLILSGFDQGKPKES